VRLFSSLLKHPLAVITLFSLASIIGLIMAFRLPLDLYPEFNPPVLTILTVYPQAGPEEVEEEVTRLLEESLGGLSGLDRMTSVSGSSVSRLTLEFRWDEEMIPIENEVRSRLGQLKGQLPEEAEEPVIYKFDMNDEPVVELTVRTGSGLSPAEAYNLAEKTVRPALEQVDGVAAAELSGIRDEIVEVAVIRNRLEAFHLSLTGLAQQIARQNSKLGSGTMDDRNRRVQIQSEGSFSSLKDIGNTVVLAGNPSAANGGSIRIEDLGQVSRTLEDRTESVRINGDPGIRIAVIKQSDANVVRTTDLVLERVDALNRTLPPGYELIVISESTGLIRLVIRTLLTSGLIGGLLAVGVLILFLREVRTTLIILLSIPVSLLMALAGLAFAGKTLNILTMGGMILGLGMIVDGSIVVLENIMRYRENGVPPVAAAEQGVREMASPITGSTVTSLCVFLPLLFLGDGLDLLGVLFRDMAVAVILALSASLAVSLFLIPVLSALLLKRPAGPEASPGKGIAAAFSRLIEKALTGLEGVYRSVLNRALSARGVSILAALILFVSGLLLYPLLGWQFLPATGEESIILEAEFPPGTTLDEAERIMDEVYRAAEEEIPWAEAFLVTAEPGGGRLKAVLPPLDQRPATYEEVQTAMRKRMNRWPSAEFEFISTDMAVMLGNTGKIILRLQGESLEDLFQTEEEITRLLRDLPGVEEIRSDREKENPELAVRINRDRAFKMGLSMAQIAAELRADISGVTATVYRDDGKALDVVLRLREEDRSVRTDLEKLFLINSGGVKIPLSSVAVLSDEDAPAGIRRQDQNRTIEMTLYLSPGIRANFLQKEMEVLLADSLNLPDGIILNYGGEMEDVQQYGASLLMIFGLAALLVFGVMICQFESLRDPFIIMLVLPLMIIGITLAFFLMRLPVNMVTIIGAVMLAGIVVNNGIVLVDYTNLLVRRGQALRDACLNAGQSRLRPVLMTTLTTVLAMVPIGFFPGEGGALIQPLGLTIVGGLCVSTLMTLFLVPLLYYQFNRRRRETAGLNVRSAGS